MKEKVRGGGVLKKIVLVLLFVAALITSASAEGTGIYLLKVDGAINPATAGYIVRGIDKAEQDGAVCLVIQLDTPGGLMESMRTIVKRILGARLPVIVYVAPGGSRAGFCRGLYHPGQPCGRHGAGDQHRRRPPRQYG